MGRGLENVWKQVWVLGREAGLKAVSLCEERKLRLEDFRVPPFPKTRLMEEQFPLAQALKGPLKSGGLGWWVVPCVAVLRSPPTCPRGAYP